MRLLLVNQEGEIHVGDGNNVNVSDNLLSSSTEFDVSLDIVENPINVTSDQEN